MDVLRLATCSATSATVQTEYVAELL